MVIKLVKKINLHEIFFQKNISKELLNLKKEKEVLKKKKKIK